MKDVVSHYNLDSFVKLSHRVVGAWWNDDKGQWSVKIQRGDDPNDTFFDHGEILINATGVLK